MNEVIASGKWAAVAVIAVLLLILLVVFIYKESTGFHVVHYSVFNSKLKKDSFRFILISDMHDNVYGDDNIEVLNAIDNEKPDAILLAGDMVTSHMEPGYHDGNAMRFVKALSEKYPVYYGIGNHEENLRRCADEYPGMYDRLNARLAEAGLHLLLDEKVSIEEAGIDIYGLDLEHKYYRKLKTFPLPEGYLEEKFGKNDRERISILIPRRQKNLPNVLLSLPWQ